MSYASPNVFTLAFSPYTSFINVNADICGLHPVEESETFLNIEGRPQ